MNASQLLALGKLMILNAVLMASVACSSVRQSSEPGAAPAEGTVERHGYMIANYTIKDPETFKKYMEAAGTLAPRFNGKVIVFDVNAKALEGHPKQIVAIAEFPSVAATEKFYNSPEYAAARVFRVASTEGSVVLAEGLPSSTSDGTNGYMVANYTIKNQEVFKKYMETAGPLAPRFTGRVIVYDANAKTLEGNPESITAIAEFPSVADAERFYDSPQYTAVRSYRVTSTEGSVMLAGGLPHGDQQTDQSARQAENAHMSDKERERFIDSTVDLFTQSSRTPVLRTPNEYGMPYEDVFFSAMDGVTLEGWFIPAKFKSDRLIVINHPMPANRYGYPGHLDPWKGFGGFEVNFLPEYRALHDAGYNILTYDMRNHGRSGVGSGGLLGHGLFEYRDVVGSLRYARTRPGTKNMSIALYSRCLGANATIVAMKKHPEEFGGVKALLALQPVTPKVFLERAMEMNGIENGIELFAKAYYNRSGLHLDQVWPMEYAKAVTVPTLIVQVHDDFLTKPSNVQEIFDTISASDKRLFWIEGTDKRFEGYNYFGKNPELMLEWFNSHF